MSDDIFESIHLHIGHGKTGTSFLQSALALAGDRLTAHDVNYPLEEDVALKARDGFISSGNFWPRDGAVKALVDLASKGSGKKLLISSEALFNSFGGQNMILMNKITALSDERNVLLFVRSPVEHAISVYQQRIKRGGYTSTLSEYLSSYNVPVITMRVIKRLNDRGFTVTVRDYSQHKANLAGVFESWIGLPRGTLPKPPREVINRSLTNAELELQRALNVHLDSSIGWVLSDALCNNLPEVKSEVPFVTHDALKTFIDRMQKVMSSHEYQAVVPEESRPYVGTFNEHKDMFPTVENRTDFYMSSKQLTVIGNAIGIELSKLTKLRQQLKAVKAKAKSV